MEFIRVDSICKNGGTQVRAQTDWLVVDDYVHAMKEGAVFPPVVVFFDGRTHWLADGFHRVEAAERAGVEEIAADVRRGVQRDAVLFACGANASHGLRRTNADKRRAVETLLKDAEWATWSDSEIARRCAVTHPFVAGLRPKLTCNDYKSTTRKGADGRTINTSNIGKRSEPKPPPAEPQLPLASEPNPQPQPEQRPEPAPQAKQHPQPEPETQPQPEPEPEPTKAPPIAIINADAQRVGELVSDPVHLVVTSPPYNVGIEYDQHTDDLSTYLPMLMNVWRGCYQVMADGARIAVVVPFGVGRNPYTPFDCQIMQTLIDVGFSLRGRIIWDKNTTGNRTSWGSYRLPSSPSIRDTTECIIVAHKGSDSLEIPAELKHRDEKGTCTDWLADGDYFMGLAQDHWVVAPESAQRIKHPAPFPVELVTRLIHFYGFPGAHILDPFGGSGTVGVAAKQLGCQATLIELSADYCALAQRRIA